MTQRAGGCILFILGTFLLAGCAADQADMAARGRDKLIGLNETDVRMCAGHPAATAPVEHGEIWMYEHGASQIGPGLTALPVPYGISISEPSGRYCRVQLRFVDNRVVEVAYAGATDIWGARDAACAPIIRTCIELAERRPTSP